MSGTVADGFERRYYMDWLRVFGILAVFLFHNARFFNVDGWHAKNSVLSSGMSTFVDVLSIWIMPVMFAVSGAAVLWALDAAGAGRFLRSRLKRLLVPLVFGIFLLAPHQVYIERLTRGQFKGSLVDFLPHYFEGWYGFGGNFGWMGLHLWYLEMLFLFSVLALPLFLVLRSGAARRIVDRLTALFTARGSLVLAAIPMVLFEAFLNPEELGIHDFGGWTLFAYVAFFISGFVVFSSPRMLHAVRRDAYVAVAIVVLATAVAVVVAPSDVRYGTFAYAFGYGYRAVLSWFGVLAFAGLCMRHMNFNSRRLGYANEAVLPFYILHQPVIVLLGFFIANWQMAVVPKYLLLVAASFVVIMSLYELLVRRTGILRFLFGMKPLPRTPTVREEAMVP